MIRSQNRDKKSSSKLFTLAQQWGVQFESEYPVVYSDQNGGHLAFYEWEQVGFSFISSFNITTNPTVGRMSIEGHKLYAYAVVWEENDGEMYSLGGWAEQPSSFPLIGNAKRILCPAFSAQLGKRPDIAINHGGTNQTGLKVNYTYINSNYKQVGVSFLDFEELFNTSSSLLLNFESQLTAHTNSNLNNYQEGFQYSIQKLMHLNMKMINGQ